MQDALEEAGYTVTAEATSDINAEPLEESIVFYTDGVPAIQAVAQSVARDMGGLTVQPMPGSIPVEGGSIGTATVLVMLGTDTAGESLDDLGGAAAANVQAPAPAGRGNHDDLISAGRPAPRGRHGWLVPGTTEVR